MFFVWLSLASAPSHFSLTIFSSHFSLTCSHSYGSTTECFETLMHIFYRRCVICIFSMEIKMQNAYIHCKLLRFPYLMLYSNLHQYQCRHIYQHYSAQNGKNREMFHITGIPLEMVQPKTMEKSVQLFLASFAEKKPARETFQFYVWHWQKLNENFG